jgi:hypothetical protein
MGRQRTGRFAQLDDEDRADEASQPKPPSSAALVEKVKNQEKANTMWRFKAEEPREEPRTCQPDWLSQLND